MFYCSIDIIKTKCTKIKDNRENKTCSKYLGYKIRINQKKVNQSINIHV